MGNREDWKKIENFEENKQINMVLIYIRIFKRKLAKNIFKRKDFSKELLLRLV